MKDVIIINIECLVDNFSFDRYIIEMMYKNMYLNERYENPETAKPE